MSVYKELDTIDHTNDYQEEKKSIDYHYFACLFKRF